MIKFENVEVVGLDHAIRGMRNPMNSWEKSDSFWGCSDNPYDDSVCEGCENDFCAGFGAYRIGPKDLDLMTRLAKAGPVHAKYRRMIVVYVDITAPLYWWKEFDTYKVGTVANSCSTMHKIAAKEFTLEDFSCEHLIGDYKHDCLINEDEYDIVNSVIKYMRYFQGPLNPLDILNDIINMLNKARDLYLETKDKKYWWQMIQLLPSSYNQKRTIMLNYEVLANIYKTRKDHKLDEWRKLCDWIETLPYSSIIIE